MKRVSSKTQDLINSELETGYYKDFDDLLSQAISRQRRWREEEEAETIASIQRGLDDSIAGRFVSFEEFDRNFRQRHGLPPPERASLIERPLFDGEYHEKELGDWRVHWESRGAYRFWCSQFPQRPKYWIGLVLFNPGSLSGDGERLAQDSTLRNIRTALTGMDCGALILNLFPFASPKPEVLCREHWQERDDPACTPTAFAGVALTAFAFAYGDIHVGHGHCKAAVTARVEEYREAFHGVPEVQLPVNKGSGNPAHAMNWIRNGHMESVRALIIDVLKKAR